MLTIATTITQRAEQDQLAFQTANSDWDTIFFQSLKTRIQTAILKLNPELLITQKTLTAQLTKQLKNASHDLDILAAAIESKFTGDHKIKGQAILGTLEIKRLQKVKSGDQESLAQILAAFKANETTILPQLQSKKISPSLISRIQQHYITFQPLNIKQELAKGDVTKNNEKQQLERNAIYTQIAGISKLGKKLSKLELTNRADYNISLLLRKIKNNT